MKLFFIFLERKKKERKNLSASPQVKIMRITNVSTSASISVPPHQGSIRIKVDNYNNFGIQYSQTGRVLDNRLLSEVAARIR